MIADYIANRQILAGIILALAVVPCGGSCWAAAGHGPIPEWRQIELAVWRQFEALADYQPGQIITRGDAEPIFKHKLMGWLGADRTAILNQLPEDDDFLVRQLRTRPGRKFGSQVAAYAHAYDRLDRLSRLPRGRRIVEDLIKSPGGYKLIEYMTTSPGGAELGRMLSKAPKGKDFNGPTGRIYTVEMLLARLKQSHTKAKKTEAEGKNPRSERRITGSGEST